MSTPPGLRYIFSRILPELVVPSAVTYLVFQLWDIYSPLWIKVTAVILFRILISLTISSYTKWVNERAAIANGAILPPLLRESTFALMAAVRDDVQNGYPGDIVEKWSKIYGNIFQCEFPTTSLVVTTEPEHIKAILTSHFDDFEKGPILGSVLDSLFGTGVFNADGDTWRFHRAMARPFFTRERLSDFDIYDRSSSLALSYVRERVDEEYSVNIQDLVARFTLDSASEFLFGHNIDTLSAGIPYPPNAEHKNPQSFYTHPSNTYANVLSKSQTNTLIRFALGPDWPLVEFFRDSIKPMRTVMDAITAPMMEKALKSQHGITGEKDEKGESTFLAHLVKETQDPKIILDELMNLLIAGRDTTVSLLTYCIYMLTNHAEIEKRLRREIVDKVGISGKLDYSKMKEMRYMRAFINEVLRLYPPGYVWSVLEMNVTELMKCCHRQTC